MFVPFSPIMAKSCFYLATALKRLVTETLTTFSENLLWRKIDIPTAMRSTRTKALAKPASAPAG
jgi:hypothetical protein